MGCFLDYSKEDENVEIVDINYVFYKFGCEGKVGNDFRFKEIIQFWRYLKVFLGLRQNNIREDLFEDIEDKDGQQLIKDGLGQRNRRRWWQMIESSFVQEKEEVYL